jgi:signal transduction histidine kinase
VVLCVRDGAFDFMQAHRAAIAPGATLVHVTDDGAELGAPAPTGVVRLPLILDAAPTLALIRRLHPRCTTIAVVLGTSVYDRKWLAPWQRALAGAAEDVRWLTDLGLERTERAVAELPPQAVVVLPNFMRDGDGRGYVPAEIASRLARASAAPVYVGYSTMIGGGAAGGAVIDVERVAQQAGSVVLRLLDGADAATVQATTIRTDTVVLDWRQADRLGIAAADVPTGARVLNREPAFWERNRGWILGGSAVIVVQAALISALLVGRRRLRRATAGMVKAQRDMELASEAAQLGVWDWQVDGDQLWQSAGCRALFGVPVDAPATYARLFARIHPDDRVAVAAAVQQALSGADRYDHEFRVVLDDGTVRWLAGRGRVERDAAGRPRRMLGISLDISARKRMEADAERHRSELAHLGRVASLGELSGSLAHELNQPLTAILSNAEAALCMLDGTAPDLSELRAILDAIAGQDRRAGEIIRRMRDLLRKGESERVVIDLRTVVDEVLLLMRSELIARGVAVDQPGAAEPLRVRADRVQLQQVVINLLVNAADAMAALPVEQRRVTVHLDRVGERAACIVADCGPGIPTQDCERIFAPFFSTKAHGLGIGLAICRTLIIAHGGILVAEDHNGPGAVLRFELPLAEAP